MTDKVHKSGSYFDGLYYPKTKKLVKKLTY